MKVKGNKLMMILVKGLEESRTTLSKTIKERNFKIYINKKKIQTSLNLQTYPRKTKTVYKLQDHQHT